MKHTQDITTITTRAIGALALAVALTTSVNAGQVTDSQGGPCLGSDGNMIPNCSASAGTGSSSGTMTRPRPPPLYIYPAGNGNGNEGGQGAGPGVSVVSVETVGEHGMYGHVSIDITTYSDGTQKATPTPGTGFAAAMQQGVSQGSEGGGSTGSDGHEAGHAGNEHSGDGHGYGPP